jgi:SAM-dependent methyltransferase
MAHPPRTYDAYAAVYDAVGQGEFGAALAARTLEWAAAGRGAPLRILDLACGTGAAALIFAAAGHRVVGVDASAAMLERAAANATARGLRVRWLLSDLRRLRVGEHSAEEGVPPHEEAPSADEAVATPVDRSAAISAPLAPASFDLATCFFDSLNYLTADGDLEALFGAVARALAPGGSFVFDLNTEAEFLTWNDRDEVAHDGPDLLVYNRLRYNPVTKLASGRVVWFVREGALWRRAEELHVERAWGRRDVRAALDAAGLRLLACHTPEGAPANDDAPRAVFYAQRDQ